MTPKKYVGIYSGRKWAEEKELQGKYESEALEDLMAYESKRFDKSGKYTLKVRKTENLEIFICNPECGEPTLIQFLDSNNYSYTD